MKQYTVAIVGATGAVGTQMLQCLEEQEFPVGELKLLASPRSAGKKVETAQFVEDKQKEEFIRSQQHKLAKKSRTRRSSANKK